VTRIAVSGHRGLPVPTARLVDAALRAELARWVARGDGNLVGITSLADGADQLFARAILDAGGALEVIIPAEQYRAGLPPACWPEYDALLARAATVTQLGRVESDAEAHMDASEAMLKRADVLFAVWDGKPARGYGGTADVVAEARKEGLPVVVLWPDGARRD
jgi:hypothetical protein